MLTAQSSLMLKNLYKKLWWTAYMMSFYHKLCLTRVSKNIRSDLRWNKLTNLIDNKQPKIDNYFDNLNSIDILDKEIEKLKAAFHNFSMLHLQKENIKDDRKNNPKLLKWLKKKKIRPSAHRKKISTLSLKNSEHIYFLSVEEIFSSSQDTQPE
jgi:hypothetical protein